MAQCCSPMSKGVGVGHDRAIVIAFLIEIEINIFF
jgi:hypothetical protein